LIITWYKIREEYQALFVVRKCNIEYKFPAKFEDEIIIKTQILKFGKTYIDFLQIMKLVKNKTILTQAQINVACIDSENMKPKKIPSKILNSF